MFDLSKLSLKALPDPTGNDEPSVSLVYTDDEGEFNFGLAVNVHGGQATVVRYNASPSNRRDLILLAPDERISVSG